MMIALWIVLGLIGFAVFMLALIVATAAATKYVIDPIVEKLGLDRR